MQYHMLKNDKYHSATIVHTFFYYILFVSFIKIWNVQHKILQNQNSKTVNKKGKTMDRVGLIDEKVISQNSEQVTSVAWSECSLISNAVATK